MFLKIAFLRRVIFVPFHYRSGTGHIILKKGWSQVAPEGLQPLTRGIPGEASRSPGTFRQAKGGGEGVSGSISSPAPSSS